MSTLGRTTASRSLFQRGTIAAALLIVAAFVLVAPSAPADSFPLTDPFVDAEICRVDQGTVGVVADDAFYLKFPGNGLISPNDLTFVLRSDWSYR